MRSYPYPYNAFITEILDEPELIRIILRQVIEVKHESCAEVKSNLMAMHQNYGLSTAGLETCLDALESRENTESRESTESCENTEPPEKELTKQPSLEKTANNDGATLHQSILEGDVDETVINPKAPRDQHSSYPKVEAKMKGSKVSTAEPIESSTDANATVAIYRGQSYEKAIAARKDSTNISAEDINTEDVTQASVDGSVNQALNPKAPASASKVEGSLAQHAQNKPIGFIPANSPHNRRNKVVRMLGIVTVIIIFFQLYQFNLTKPESASPKIAAPEYQANLSIQDEQSTAEPSERPIETLSKQANALSHNTPSELTAASEATTINDKAADITAQAADKQAALTPTNKETPKNTVKQLTQRIATPVSSDLNAPLSQQSTGGTDQSLSSSSQKQQNQSTLAAQNANSTESSTENSAQESLSANQPESDADRLFKDLLYLAQDLNIEPESSPDTALGKLLLLKEIDPSYQGLDLAYHYISRGYLALSKLAHADQDPSRSNYLLGKSIHYQSAAQKIKQQFKAEQSKAEQSNP